MEPEDLPPPPLPNHDQAPSEGGRYSRDPITGELTPIDETGHPKEK